MPRHGLQTSSGESDAAWPATLPGFPVSGSAAGLVAPLYTQWKQRPYKRIRKAGW